MAPGGTKVPKSPGVRVKGSNLHKRIINI